MRNHVLPFISFFASICVLSGCGTQINTLAAAKRATSGASGVPPAVTSLTLIDGSPTNAWPLELDWGIPIGDPAQYCVLENSDDRTACIWHSGALPATYEDSAADGTLTLTAYLKNDYGVSAPIHSNAITIDRTTPVLASATVTNGDPTNSTAFGLSYGAVTGTYASYCVLVNSTDRTACAWTAGTLPVGASVPSGDGGKTLRFWLKDDAGNISSPVAAAAVNLDQTPPTLTLTSLTGGQALVGGQSASITWTGSDLYPGTTPIKLESSSDSGANWTLIEDGLANSSVYAWTVPSATSVTYRVRASFTDQAGNVRTAASASDFSINSSTPSVAVTSPDGGEIWKGGSAHAITWSAAGLPSGGGTAVAAKIEYSLNNGANWTTAAAAAPNTGTYAWTVPAAADSTQALVRVSVTDSFGIVTSDVSNANFRVDSTAPTVTLTSLTGGQTVGGGAATAINWTGSDTNPGSTPVKLEYSADSGANWTLIEDHVANSGAYSWTTPAVTSATYRVRVTFTDAVALAATSASLSDFAINSSTPVVSVTSPNGGEIWKGGSVHDVTWSSSGLPTGGGSAEEVKLEYSLDNGGAWTTIVASTPNDGTYSWSLPAATDSTQALVRVSVTDSFSTVTTAVSNANFRIDSTAPSVTLTSLTGGDVIHGGEPYDITWTATDPNLDSAPISIEVSSDGGSSYASLAAGLANSGTYSWSVPGSNSSTYRVKVIALDQAGNTGQDASASNFSIGYIPASIAIVSGNNQSGAAGAQMASDMAVVVKDSANRDISGLTIDWSVLTGGGTLAGAASATDGGGNASNRYTNSTTPGSNTIKAAVDGYPGLSVTFDAATTAAAVHHFAFSSVPSPVAASDEFSFTVTAKDQYENTLTDYAGTVAFSSSDPYAILPANYAFQAADNGVTAPAFVFRTAGSRTITVTQTAGGAPSSTTSSITVTGSPALAWNITDNDFGYVVVGQESYTQEYYLTNDGVAVARGCSAPTLAGTDPSDFAIVSDGCGTSDLLPDGNCKVTVKAVPGSGGTKTAKLRRVCSTGGTIDTDLSAIGTTTWVTSLALGNDHTCATLSDGSVKCWGQNRTYSLGDGTQTIRKTPISPSGLGTNVSQIATGLDFSCAVLTTGSVKCWGRDYEGQLGDRAAYGAVSGRSTPVSVYGVSTAVEVAAGERFACVRLSDATVKCFGNNSYGQLGRGTTSDAEGTPAAVTGLAGVAQLGLGTWYACAVLTDKTVKCWGYNTQGQLGDGTNTSRLAPTAVSSLANVEQIALGSNHACARLTDGTVKCWGNGIEGALGDGAGVDRNAPVAVPGLANVIDISAFKNSTCALVSGGALYCWGNNSSGQLGDQTTTPSLSPIEITSVPNVAKLAVGSFGAHNCVILTDKSTRCWGKNGGGQLGNGKYEAVTTPIQVPSTAGGVFTQVEASAENTCALVSDGTVKCWGSALNGLLGDPALTQQIADAHTVPGLSNVTEIAASHDHFCALIGDGTVKCWGLNSSKQLGDNTATAHTVPAPVLVSTGPSVALSGATQISLGYNNSCARISDGTVKCWGHNGNSKTSGDGNTTNKGLAVTIPALTAAVEVSAGYNYTCVRLSDGTVKCWGEAGEGQLGTGGTTDTTAPGTAVTGISTATRIVSGYGHTCALLADKTIKCWGRNTVGQLGDGTTTYRTSPITVSGISNVAEVAAGGSETCVKFTNKTVKCWGYNAFAQLGDGSATTRTSPVTPIGLPAIHRMASRGGANAYHRCMIADSDRSLWCWGSNSSSQAGVPGDLTIQRVSGGL